MRARKRDLQEEALVPINIDAKAGKGRVGGRVEGLVNGAVHFLSAVSPHQPPPEADRHLLYCSYHVRQAVRMQYIPLQPSSPNPKKRGKKRKEEKRKGKERKTK